MKKDINYIQNLEKAIEQKYGLNATLNPKHFWNEEKEKDYIEDFDKKDDVYMNKFKSCYRCYLCYIEEK